MSSKLEKELENKFKELFENHFDEIPFFKDMKKFPWTEVDMEKIIEQAEVQKKKDDE